MKTYCRRAVFGDHAGRLREQLLRVIRGGRGGLQAEVKNEACLGVGEIKIRVALKATLCATAKCSIGWLWDGRLTRAK